MPEAEREIFEVRSIHDVIICLLDAGQFDAVNKLVSAGIDIDARRGRPPGLHDTPLHWAIRRKLAPVVIFLINRGANIGLGTGRKLDIKPMDLAIETGDAGFILSVEQWLLGQPEGNDAN